MSYFAFPVGLKLRTACSGALFLQIQKVCGGRQCGAEVACLKMKVVCVGETDLKVKGVCVRNYAVAWLNINTEMGCAFML